MDIRKFCAENGLDLDYNGGFFIRGHDGRQLSGLYGSAEALEASELASRDALLLADRMDLPSEATLARYRANLDQAEARIRDGLPSRIEKHRQLMRFAGEEIADEVLGFVRRIIDSAPLHLAEIDRCRSLARNAPARLFLPLGTVVRLKKDWDVPAHYALDPQLLSGIRYGRVASPPAGSVGVVTGAGFGSDECGIAVAFPEAFSDENGHTWSYPGYGCRKVVQISDLEVLALALLPDGSPSLSVDGSPTHVADYGDGDVAEALVLDADGRSVVLFIGEDYNPLDEDAQFFGSLEEAFAAHEELEPLPAAAMKV